LLRKQIVLHYEGLLVSEELLEQFHAKYHCPTALRLPQLDYVDADGKAVQMTIIGDPTCPAAVINDGPISQRNGQAQHHCTRVRSCGNRYRRCRAHHLCAIASVFLLQPTAPSCP
jgi:hypothetical protein